MVYLLSVTPSELHRIVKLGVRKTSDCRRDLRVRGPAIDGFEYNVPLVRESEVREQHVSRRAGMCAATVPLLPFGRVPLLQLIDVRLLKSREPRPCPLNRPSRKVVAENAHPLHVP